MSEREPVTRDSMLPEPTPELYQAILDSAGRLLVQDGYNSLSMRKIAGAVGCSATSIYLYFENKDALIHALIDEGMEQLNAYLAAAFDAADEPRERLELLCRAYIGFGLGNPEYYEVMFAMHAEQMDRYPVDKYRKARRNLELFAAALRLAPASSQARDPDLDAYVIWASLHGAVALFIARRLDIRVDQQTFIDSVVRHALAAAVG
jgi:AcrR family transcriptional regulator